jgi:hypothetical protein
MVLLPLVVLFGFRLTLFVYFTLSIVTVSFGGLWSKDPLVQEAFTLTVTLDELLSTEILFSVIDAVMLTGISYPFVSSSSLKDRFPFGCGTKAKSSFPSLSSPKRMD